MAERLYVRAGGVAGRHAMENGDMVMNDEDRKFVEAVRQLADITHYMGIPIHEFPGLPAKIREAEARAVRAEAKAHTNAVLMAEQTGKLIKATACAEAADAERDAALALWRNTSEAAAQSQECAIAYQDGLHNGEAERAVAISKLMAQNAKLKEALRAASRAADLALFVIRKQGVMPNDSWQRGFEKDMAVARAALAETEGNSDDKR